MRRTLAALTAAAAAVLGLGMAGAANAAEESAQQAAVVPTDVYISEVGTQGAGPTATFNQDFVELGNLSADSMDISGYRLVVSDGTQMFTLATVPADTELESGETYLIAHRLFTGAVDPNQLFTTAKELKSRVGIGLKDITGRLVDTFATTTNTVFRSGRPAAPLTKTDGIQGLTQHRVQFTGEHRADFQKMTASPGLPG